jgi:hypothetical protein
LGDRYISIPLESSTFLHTPIEGLKYRRGIIIDVLTRKICLTTYIS